MSIFSPSARTTQNVVFHLHFLPRAVPLGRRAALPLQNRLAPIQPEAKSKLKVAGEPNKTLVQVAGLAPVTAENFDERVLAQKAQQSNVPAKRADHIKQTKKTRARAPQPEVPPKIETTDEATAEDTDSEPEPLDLTECLFCPRDSVDLDAKLRHMAKSHGFFIPDVEYVSNLKGLVEHLDWKVGVANACLYCVHGGGDAAGAPRQFTCVEAAQNHMRDKAHCRMRYDETCAEEYADYYDFSAYRDGVVDGGEMSVSESTGELVLPSGSRAGHRSLQRYFKQSIPPDRCRQLKHRVITHYRALGWRGDEEAIVRKEFRMGQFAKQRRDLAGRVALGVKANKLQHHFRCQIMF